MCYETYDLNHVYFDGYCWCPFDRYGYKRRLHLFGLGDPSAIRIVRLCTFSFCLFFILCLLCSSQLCYCMLCSSKYPVCEPIYDLRHNAIIGFITLVSSHRFLLLCCVVLVVAFVWFVWYSLIYY